MEKDLGNKKNIFLRILSAIWGWIKRHKVLTIILVIVLALVIYIAYVVGQAKKILENNSFDMATVETRDLSNTISATGKIVGVDKKTITAPLTGVEVLEVNVEVGDKVTEGQVIAVLDSSKLEDNLDIASKQLAVTESNTQLGINGAYRTYDNAQISRNVDAEKADTNIARAWDDYAKACSQADEAGKKYNDAIHARESAQGELNRLSGEKTVTNNAYNDWQARYKEKLDTVVEGLETIGICETDINLLKSYDVATISGCVMKATKYSQVPDETADPTEFASYLSVGLSDFRKTNGEFITEISTIDGYVSSLKTFAEGYSTDIAEAATLEASYSTAEASYKAAKSSEEAAKASYESACNSANKLLQTYYDMINAKDATLRADDMNVASSRDNYTTTKNNASVGTLSTEQNIEDMKSQIEDCTVKASISGTVTAVNVAVGDKYAGTAIVTIEDESKYQVSAQIDEYDIPKIKLGQEVIIRTNGTGDTELKGEVSYIAPHATASASSSAVTYEILIDVLTPNDDLKMDMTAKISIVTESKKACKCLPGDAIQTDDEGGQYVEIFNANATMGEDGTLQYERIYVKTGMVADYYTEVISDELTDDLQIVIPAEYDNSLYDLSMELN